MFFPLRPTQLKSLRVVKPLEEEQEEEWESVGIIDLLRLTCGMEPKLGVKQCLNPSGIGCRLLPTARFEVNQSYEKYAE
jgi:hypothetical protein